METPAKYLKYHSSSLNESGYHTQNSAQLTSLSTEERTFDIKYRHDDETPFIPKKKSFELKSEISKISKIKFEDDDSFFNDSFDDEMNIDEDDIKKQKLHQSISQYETQMAIEEDTILNNSFYDIFGPLRHAKKIPNAVINPSKSFHKLHPLYPQRISLEGQKYVDFIRCLGHDADYKDVLDTILRYLEPKDLSVITMVSKTWRSVCVDHKKLNKLRMEYLEGRKKRKENLIHNRTPKKKYCSPRLTRNGTLSQLQSVAGLKNVNVNILPRLNNVSKSPPVSPSKRKFHNYLKAAQRCSSNESLSPCPRCNLPAIKTGTQGRCSRLVCQFVFCTLCRAPFHGVGNSCQIVEGYRHRETHIGSKRSKNFLRRL